MPKFQHVLLFVFLTLILVGCNSQAPEQAETAAHTTPAPVVATSDKPSSLLSTSRDGHSGKHKNRSS